MNREREADHPPPDATDRVLVLVMKDVADIIVMIIILVAEMTDLVNPEEEEVLKTIKNKITIIFLRGIKKKRKRKREGMVQFLRLINKYKI